MMFILGKILGITILQPVFVIKANKKNLALKLITQI